MFVDARSLVDISRVRCGQTPWWWPGVRVASEGTLWVTMPGYLKAAWMMRADEVSRLPRAPSSCASCPARRNTLVLPICTQNMPDK